MRMSVIPSDPNLFDGPRVWTSRDFHSPSDWSLWLSDETRNELRSAVDHAKKRGLEPFTREDFPLPSFASTAAEIRRRLEDGIGFNIGGVNTPASETPITPIIIGGGRKTMEFSRALFDAGVLGTGIAFPTVPEGKARIRTIMTSEHTREQLDQALGILEKTARQMGILS